MANNLMEMSNGALLSRFNGKKVSVIGLVTQVNPNGLTFDMRTTDDVPLKVNFRRPFSDPLEGYVDVHGTAQGKVIICDEIIPFTMDKPTDFDVASHNGLCNILHLIPNLYKKSNKIK